MVGDVPTRPGEVIMLRIKARISGIASMLHHSVRLANKREPITQEMAKITARRNKSEEDLETISRLEWAGGLYFVGEYTVADSKVLFDEGARLVLPADNIAAAIIAGARVSKLGKTFESAVFIEDDGTFEYDGPKDLNELATKKRFIDYRSAAVQKNKVMRTRPVFPKWSSSFTVTLDEEQADIEHVRTALMLAGERKGIGDWRPRFGRFIVDSFEV